MSERFEIVVLPRADKDAQRIFEWLRKQSPQGAATWYSTFLEAVERLAQQGDVYGLAPEAESIKRPIRQKLFRTSRGRTYRILFEIDRDRLYVLHVRAPGQKLVDRGNQ